ncbi:nucleotidyltransferase family protein [Meiothermus sp.]|jgi:predicted nucleotidyltransferase|uniref:nucleotidyltransferase family protein n=1 Tax=Meiothermus sp. TaxID=1955249 RepID=UPI0021DB9C2F|nr:nucleotidyltransferase family protein [Meiothermus sp.]GIW24759.1 MAG: nucleotidyltransferase [Meiothermus sp.]
MRRGSVLAILEEPLPGLAKRYRIKSLYLFGSTARDEAGPESDVDLLVRLEEPTFELYIGLKHELEDMLGSKVDLVSAKKVPPGLRSHIEADALQLV